jgi:hypothetical protein
VVETPLSVGFPQDVQVKQRGMSHNETLVREKVRDRAHDPVPIIDNIDNASRVALRVSLVLVQHRETGLREPVQESWHGASTRWDDGGHSTSPGPAVPCER